MSGPVTLNNNMKHICDRCQHEVDSTICVSLPVKYIDKQSAEALRLLSTELCEQCLGDLNVVTEKYLIFEKGE